VPTFACQLSMSDNQCHTARTLAPLDDAAALARRLTQVDRLLTLIAPLCAAFAGATDDAVLGRRGAFEWRGREPLLLLMTLQALRFAGNHAAQAADREQWRNTLDALHQPMSLLLPIHEQFEGLVVLCTHVLSVVFTVVGVGKDKNKRRQRLRRSMTREKHCRLLVVRID
jgi:hypothetical protein